jgi:hypothetical protein
MMNVLEQIIKAQTSKALHAAALLSRPNVVACGVGYKVSGGQVTDEPSVVVSVVRKLPLAELADSDLIPGELEGVRTDVIETGVLRAWEAGENAEHRARWRPTAPPGVSIGHASITAGTFGCLVRRGGESFILSNNHVLACSNAAQPGDPILQPGPTDGGTAADKIAELADYVAVDFGQTETQPSGCSASVQRVLQALAGRSAAYTPRQQSDTSTDLPEAANEVDAALARPLSADLVNANILKIGVPAGVAQAELGTQVQKSGRTTGHTTGSIIQIDVSTRISYGDQTALFVNQLMADGMSAGGDSGSAVLDMERNVVGLLFAGSGVATVMNPIQKVLTALDIQIVTG